MGRKPVPDDLRKENLNIVLPRWQIDKLKEIRGYNKIIEKLLEEFFKSENFVEK